MAGGIFEKYSQGDQSAETRRKQQILEAAAQVFSRLGYGATIDQIAEEMGVTKGHIYYYYTSKQEILFQIFRQAMDFFLQETTAASCQKIPVDQRLKAVFKKHIIAICENRAIMTVFMDLRRDLLPEHWREIAASRNEYERLIQSLILEGMEKGFFIPENEKILSFTLLGAINWVYVWFQEQGDLDQETVAGIMAEYLLRGLNRRPLLQPFATGKSVQEIAVGDSASFSKTISDADVFLFAGITGDLNPRHVSDEYARATAEGRRPAQGELTASLVAPVIGTIMPGLGTEVLETGCRYLAPVFPGDTITARATVVKKNEAKNLVTLKLSWVNQEDVEVATGETVVKPPAEGAR